MKSNIIIGISILIIVCSVLSLAVIHNSSNDGENLDFESDFDFDVIKDRKNLGAIIKYLLAVNSIQHAVKTNTSTMYHKSFKTLAYLVDTYGPRLWGSPQLELTIQDLYQQALNSNFDNVFLDPINFTKWVRGDESLTLYDPRPIPQQLKVIGLGTTVPGNVTAEVIVVQNFDQLNNVSSQVAGKIVLFNPPQWVNYSYNVQYRSSGPSAAAQYGAVGCLVRSVTPFSIESPHTGVTHTTIPAAAITVEDAEMFQRMQDRGQKIVVNLYLNSTTVSNASSYNVVADFKGSTFPEQMIVIGGHIDSWDTGSQTGANDDGGGFVTCFEAVRTLISLGLRPKRTIRFMAWSGEEYGGTNSGAYQYVNNHLTIMNNTIMVFESDEGSTTPYGFGFTGSSNATSIVKNIAETYLSTLNCSIITDDGVMVDSQAFYNQGVPALKNLILDTPSKEYYFTYHHSAGDSMTMMNADQLDDNVVCMASMFYILSDWNVTLPR